MFLLKFTLEFFANPTDEHDHVEQFFWEGGWVHELPTKHCSFVKKRTPPTLSFFPWIRPPLPFFLEGGRHPGTRCDRHWKCPSFHLVKPINLQIKRIQFLRYYSKWQVPHSILRSTPLCIFWLGNTLPRVPTGFLESKSLIFPWFFLDFPALMWSWNDNAWPNKIHSFYFQIWPVYHPS